MARIKLRYVNAFVDRHGKVRYYFRRRGSRSVKLPGLPGSIEFMSAYQAALATVAPPPASPKHVIRGSLTEVTTGYFRSAAFANLSASSQQVYRLVLNPVLAAHGHRLVREMPKAAARNIIEAIGATRPGKANLTRAALSQVMAYAIATGVRTDNPFSGLEQYRLGTDHTWTEAEIVQFERCWRLGTRERLAYALLLYTGQRGGDVVKMTRNDIVDGYIRVSQDKARKGTTNELMIPIHPALARALKAGPVVERHEHPRAGGDPAEPSLRQAQLLDHQRVKQAHEIRAGRDPITRPDLLQLFEEVPSVLLDQRIRARRVRPVRLI